MLPTAYLAMTETLLRIVSRSVSWPGCFCRGLHVAAAGAMAGIAVGELSGL